MKNKGYRHLTWRLDIGYYALNKLACSGLAFLLIILAVHAWDDWTSAQPSLFDTFPVPPAHFVYGYAMLASIAADLIIVILRPLSRFKQFLLYAVSGISCMAFLPRTSDELVTQHVGVALVAGVIVLAIYYGGKLLFSRQPLLLPLFAWIIPIILFQYYG